MPAMRSKSYVVGWAGVWISVAVAGQTPSPPAAKTGRVEIDARGQVVSAPRRPVGKSGRQLVEFEIELLAYLLAPEQPPGADRSVPVDMTGRVRVQHDLSCGGSDLDLAVGDKVELRGLYVRSASGSLIRFTHSPGAEGCGEKAHPAGYLREVFPVTPTPAVTPPRPAVVVPDQTYVGTPASSEKPYAEILRMKQAGASEEKLLEKIAAGKKVYSMSLEDVRTLRGAGVSYAVIEAMMQSGRHPITPGQKPAPSPTPGS
jgi:hypothetical protein